ncbi:hypothetical protein QTI66_32720 [Variovorax sp. J22R133]|uniref:hypothetical protein n=1 Tax=Variovorax brevis TaxID=3053503 RepID=UPI002576A838|nr:hypothetical protein [Variovorax sp. J22R133]MDM0116892.1 hypothetical protein [Variovorax sp. J22R133]
MDQPFTMPGNPSNHDVATAIAHGENWLTTRALDILKSGVYKTEHCSVWNQLMGAQTAGFQIALAQAREEAGLADGIEQMTRFRTELAYRRMTR